MAPRLIHDMIAAGLAGDVVKGREINQRLLPLHQKLFVEANPIPVKWVVARMGLAGGALRLPMTPLMPQFHAVLEDAMRQAGISF